MEKMERPVAPCKDCKERKEGCHSECEGYKAFEQANKEYKLHFNDGMDEFDRYKTSFRKKQR